MLQNIHSTVVFFNRDKVKIGNNVRIDCFSVISAGPDGIEIGDNVHIGAGVYIFGGGGKVTLERFCGISPRSILLTSTDDFVSGHLAGPCVPSECRNVSSGPVTLKRYALVGCGSVVLPGVTIGTGAAVGALSLVKSNIADYAVMVGTPLRLIAIRDRELLERMAAKCDSLATPA